jgi:hypothetical protein
MEAKREKWKQGDQGTKRAWESKEKEKPRPYISKNKIVLKRKTSRRKLLQETGLPWHPTCLFVVHTRHPIVVTNQKDKGVAVLKIVHSPIHIAVQFIPGPGQLLPPFPLLINGGMVRELNSCGSCMGWEVG